MEYGFRLDLRDDADDVGSLKTHKREMGLRVSL